MISRATVSHLFVCNRLSFIWIFCFQPPSRKSLQTLAAASKLRRAWRRRQRAAAAGAVCSLEAVAATSPPPSTPPRQPATRGSRKSQWTTTESAPVPDLESPGVSHLTPTLAINTTQQEAAPPRLTSPTPHHTRPTLIQRPPNCRPAFQVEHNGKMFKFTICRACFNDCQLQDPTADPPTCLSCTTRNLTSTEPKDPILLQLTLEQDFVRIRKSAPSAFLLSQVIRAWLQSTKCLSKESPRSEETKESDQFQIDVWDQFKTFALRAYQTDSCHAPIDFLVSYYWTNWHLPGFWLNIAYLGFIF